MLKLTRTYKDYNGVSRTEDFYFNLTQAEVTELELSVDGGLVEMINRIVAAQDGKQIIAIFKDIILRALTGSALSRTRSCGTRSPRRRRTAICSWSWPPMRKRRPGSSTASSPRARRLRLLPVPPRLRHKGGWGDQRCWNL